MAFTPFSFRAFLNKRGFHSGAYVYANVELVSDWPGDPDRPQVDARLTVADCNRIAGLDFSCADPAEAANALHKARLLRRVVSEFVDALETAITEAGSFEDADAPSSAR